MKRHIKEHIIDVSLHLKCYIELLLLLRILVLWFQHNNIANTVCYFVRGVFINSWLSYRGG